MKKVDDQTERNNKGNKYQLICNLNEIHHIVPTTVI